MSGAHDHSQEWAALSPELREQVAAVITTCGPDRTAQVIAAGLTAEQQPHATAIADAFERALDWQDFTPEEKLGTAMVNAHRRGEDPVKILREALG